MSRTWNRDRADENIDSRLKEVSEVHIVDYKKETSLDKIPSNKAYRVDAPHIYIDILNIEEILGTTDEEGPRCHRKTLRFLNQHFRAVDRVLRETGCIRVDYHNQRLHAVVPKPYGDENHRSRIERSIAIADLISQVLDETGDDDEGIPNAKVRVGIDSGIALAVRNGRRGNREPLFLGDPANKAAKMASDGMQKGIFVSNRSRKVANIDIADNPLTKPLSKESIRLAKEAAELNVNADDVVDDWRADLDDSPIGDFEFSSHKPPMKDLDIMALTPGNSRRQELVSMYADIDGFTDYINRNIDASPEDVVKVFHVLRSEMERVLSIEFEGRRIRFVGDCVHGVLVEGTQYNTDAEKSVSTAILCAAAIRSSFERCIEKLEEAGVEKDGLGIAIGLAYGPVSITRLGLHGSRVRCSLGRAVLSSESEQKRCDGRQNAIDERAFNVASDAVRDRFGQVRRVTDWDFNEAVESLADAGDDTASKSRKATFENVGVGYQDAVNEKIRPHCEQ